MAAYASITTPLPSGTCSESFFDNADALDAIIDQLHAAIDAEAFIGNRFFDIELSQIAHQAADAWATCETATLLFLARPNLEGAHVLAAEHVLDVLQDRGLDHNRLRTAPVSLMRAACRVATRVDLESLVLTRQLSHLSSVLRAIIDDSETAAVSEPDPDFDPGVPSLA
ncbi:hypothetical protein OCH239_18875 [Roseivivax halodurans JCM 10272]|uniref:Uncharacterized protein n=1 Tax=Roseivivax halodurans JCM 10272 TaxID=1449350 RepID=X7E7Q9_9RHOB|nr:hypothetical protein [Roseivivax halodurans]ETX11967.1 hypothetical protein OCH239_18875 [Roseivivax halodurans JCM 10272]